MSDEQQSERTALAQYWPSREEQDERIKAWVAERRRREAMTRLHGYVYHTPTLRRLEGLS